MRALTSALLHHRVVVLVILGAFIAMGLQSYLRLPIEAYPDVTNIQLQIITLFPGHAAEEVEQQITVPIENEMNGIPQRVSMRSQSLFGLSVVTLVFDDDADNQFVRNQAYQHIAAVNLPPNIQAAISPDSTPIGEIYRYSLRAPQGFPLVELKAIEDWVVERKFRTVPGVVDVVGFGGPTLQYQVQLDPAKLKSYNITLKQVLDALANSNKNAGGAYIEHGSEMYVVRGIGLLKTVQDIGAVAVATRNNGVPVAIKDLGTVQIGERLRLGRVGLATRGVDGHKNYDTDDAVQGILLLRKGENALDVLQRVELMADQINEKYLPNGVRLVPHYDRTELIHHTLHTVMHNMVEGILLVLLTLILFLGLGNWRSALVVASVVPVALLGAFLLLDLRGVPANLISMGAIDFGIIVDSAVVVIEHILLALEKRKKEERKRRSVLWEAIVHSMAEMGKPIMFSKLILLTAFIPLFTMQRVEGKIFRPMALTLTFALIVGTILALTIVPTLAVFALRPGISDKESILVRLLKAIYEPLLSLVLKLRYVALALALAALAAGGICLSRLGSEFLPKLDEGALWVRSELPESIGPSEAREIVTRIRKRLMEFPEVKTVVTQNGRPDDGTDSGGFNNNEMFVDLIPREQWTTARDRETLTAIMDARMSPDFPGVKFEFSQVIEDNVNEAVSGIKGGELGVKIFGDNPVKLQHIADQIVATLKGVQGAGEVGSEHLLGQPQVQIIPDAKALARIGLGVADVQSIIETALGGSAATQILQGERSFDLMVKYASHTVSDLDGIRNIPVLGANGERLSLGNLATVEVHPGFARIYREENQRRIAVRFAAKDRDLGSLIAEAQEKVNKNVPLPQGYHMEWTGAFENQQRAVKRLMIVVPITIGLVFFLLLVMFDAVSFAILILLNVPFAALGGIFVLPLAGLNLSVSALVGFIALFGVSVQNGVLLIERIRELRLEGLPMAEAVKTGAESRVRPVVMTATMAALGLLPAALSQGVGAETARPFAVVIIGGLFTATLLTLFILPILYPWFEPKSKVPEELDEENPHALLNASI